MRRETLQNSKRFINTTLGEEWEDESAKLKSSELLKRTEDIDQRVIPPGCLALTVGVDTQDEWLAVKLLDGVRVNCG